MSMSSTPYARVAMTLVIGAFTVAAAASLAPKPLPAPTVPALSYWQIRSTPLDLIN